MKCLTTLVFVFVLCFTSFAQRENPRSGSPYSVYGVGILQKQTFGQVDALGGAGIGLRAEYFVNSANPAALNAVKAPVSMMLNFGFQVSGTKMEDQSTSANRRDGQLSHLNLWFRPCKKAAFSLGITPYSQVGYTLITDRFSPIVGDSYQVTYSGSGGLARAYLGGGYEVLPGLNLGANLNFIFGSIEREEVFSGSENFTNFTYENKTHLRDWNADFGIQYQLPFFGKYKVVVGGVYAPKADFFSKEVVTLSAIASETLEDTESSDKLFSTPTKIGFGLSVATKKWLWTTDWEWEKWSEVSYVAEDAKTVDTYKWAAGMEYAPFLNKFKGYRRQLLVRGGFEVQNNYLQIDGVNFIDWRITAGLGIPVGKKSQHLNLTYTYARTGSDEKNLFQETTHQVGVSFALRDIWFVKRQFN